MSLLIPGTNSIKDTGYDVANSVRLDGNAYLHKTQSGGNRKTWTMSCWTKLTGAYGSNGGMLMAANGTNDGTNFLFGIDNGGHSGSATDTLSLHIYGADGFRTTPVLRDYTAWYHIVLAMDTTQGTSTNRLKLYVNNVQQTLSEQSDYPAQDAEMGVNNNGTVLGVGNHPGSTSTYAINSYMAEFVLIDGLQLAPTEFGEYDSDSPTIWKPKDVSGLTFGTNGFYLDFEDASNLGNDVNGGTDLTEVSLAATDQSLDTCTNNHAVGNPLLNYNPNLTEGNLLLASTGTAWKNAMSTIGLSSGKWYHEVLITAESAVPYGLIGVTDSYHPNSWGASPPNYVGVGALQIGYFNNNGTYYKSDSQNSYGASFTVNDIIGVLLDLDAGTPTIKFYKNDADQGSINLPTSSNSTGLWFFMHSVYIQTMSINYGSPAHAISTSNTDANGYGNFEFATKGGYTLNTKNLAEFG